MDPKYILVDYHGDNDFVEGPDGLGFCGIPKREIQIYFYYSRETGRKTCRAKCNHCFFMIPGAEEQSIPFPKAQQILHDLQAEGYDVSLTPADSFSDDILESGEAGSAQRIPGLGMVAWTSGTPLAQTGWEQRLDRGWEIGFRSITMNGHDAAGTEVPFKGVTRKALIDRALANLKTWNEKNRADGREFTFGVTFTITRLNFGADKMEQMIQYGLDNGIGTIRFNCFANFLRQPEHEGLMLSRQQIEDFYRILAEAHVRHLDANLQLSVSEDFGQAGMQHIEPYIAPELRGRGVGLCRAGWRLFAITPIDGVLRVVGCVDRMWPYLGRVVIQGASWTIIWDEDAIVKLNQGRLPQDDGSTPLYGCFGGVGRDRGDDAGFNTKEGNNLLASFQD